MLFQTMRRALVAAAVCGALSLSAAEPQRINLWPNGAPGAQGTDPKDTPAMTIYPAPEDKATRSAVVVLPGGGYGGLAMGHEGKDIAAWLNERGVHAFVVEYRLGPKYRHPAPLQDAQRAIRTVRKNAAEWKIDPAKVAVWGFSAGGHLASTLATHFDKGNPEAVDAVEKESCRPDLAILCYPVITMLEPHTHLGSKNNLLGKNPPEELVTLLCNEKQVTADTPPTFLFHTSEDKAVPPENSVLFYEALRKAKVPCEMHIYEKGTHGVGLAAKDPVLSTWPARLQDWLKTRDFLPK